MIKNSLALLGAAATLALLAGCDSLMVAPQPAVPAIVNLPAMPMNGVLVAPNGKTLYQFDKDTANAGTSVCNDACAALWLPLAAGPADAPRGNFAIVTRDDGSRQWAYKGWPVYLYSKDNRAGDMAGDNFKGIWHAVKN